MFAFKVGKKLKVFLPFSVLEKDETVCLYGYYKKDSGIFNVVSTEKGRNLRYLGKLYASGEHGDAGGRLCGYRTGDTAEFYYKGQKYETETYSLYLNIFSRNKGILESDVMRAKRAVILGCGSVGSLVALELARSGVGHFMLVDTDVLEYHNICRHQCGISEVGEYKVDLIEKRIHNINPAAHVVEYRNVVEHISQEQFAEFCVPGDTLFIGCADNRAADVYANRIAAAFGCAFLSIGFWERALAGEIFYWLPGENMPCCGCALGDGGGLSGRVSANNHHVYSNEVNIEKLKFEPGISVDINFITCIGIKLALDILNRGNGSYIPRLLNNLQQYTLVCNTSDPAIGGEMVEIFSYPLQVTTSLVVHFGKGCGGKCRYEE